MVNDVGSKVSMACPDWLELIATCQMTHVFSLITSPVERSKLQIA